MSVKISLPKQKLINCFILVLVDYQSFEKVSKSAKFIPKQTLGLDGSIDLSKPKEEIIPIPVKTKQSKPQDTLRPFGELDLSSSDSIDYKAHENFQKNHKIRPKQTLGLDGSLDLSSSDRIDYKFHENFQKNHKIRPKQTLGLDGSLDLSRPDSINQQIPKLKEKSTKYKREDTLGLHGDLDLSRCAWTNF